MLKNKNINDIIFDFGGVIINIEYKDTINAFKDLGVKNFDSMYSQSKQSRLFNQLETGHISKKNFIKKIKCFMPVNTPNEKIISAWNAMIKDIPQKTIDYLIELKSKGYRIFLLSNTNEIHMEEAMKSWNKNNYTKPEKIFNKIYLSYKIGMRKPNKEIFNFICDKENLDPSKTLFIDDSIQHIKGAKSIGLSTHHLLNQVDLYSLFS